MKRKSQFAAFLLVIVLLVTGCSGSGSNSGSASTDEKKIELTMSAWGNPAEIKVYQRALDEYEKQNPNIKVKLIPVPSDNYEQKLLT